MDVKHMGPQERKMAERIDSIYDRQGEIHSKMTGLLSESAKLRKENEMLLKKLGWW